MTGAFVQYDPDRSYHVEYQHRSPWPLCDHGYVSGGCAVCHPVDGSDELVAMAPPVEEE